MKKPRIMLLYILCVLVAFVTLPVNAFANVSIVKQGDTSEIHWELDDTGTLEINLKSGASDWTAGFPTDTLNTVNGESVYVACPWGEYTRSEDGRVLTADYSAVKKIVIGEGIKTVPNYSFVSNFYNNPNDIKSKLRYHTGVTEIVLPSTLTKIGMYTFTEMKFTEIHLENYKLTEIGNSAFENVPVTGRVILPNTLEKLGTNVFRTYSAKNVSPNAKLTEVVIPANSPITSIPNGTFDGQNHLRLVIMPVGINSVKDYSFRGCPNLNIIFTGDAPEFSGTNGVRPFSGGAKMYYTNNATGWTEVLADTVGVNEGDIASINAFAPDYTDYGVVNSGIMWLFGGDKLTLKGKGAYGDDFLAPYAPWNAHLEQIGCIELDADITDVTDKIGRSNSKCLFSPIEKTGEIAKVMYSNFTNKDENCLFAAVGYDEIGKAVEFNGSMSYGVSTNTSGVLIVHFPKNETIKRSKAYLWKNIAGETLQQNTERNLYID